MKFPIFDNRDGRTVIGYAEGIRSAGAQIRRMIDIPAGSTLYVWKRRDDMADLLDLPVGFVYSIGR